MSLSEQVKQQYVNDVVDSWDMQDLVEYAEAKLKESVDKREIDMPLDMEKEILDFYHIDSIQEVKLTYYGEK